jgi:hypothetical protein
MLTVCFWFWRWLTLGCLPKAPCCCTLTLLGVRVSRMVCAVALVCFEKVCATFVSAFFILTVSFLVSFSPHPNSYAKNCRLFSPQGEGLETRFERQILWLNHPENRICKHALSAESKAELVGAMNTRFDLWRTHHGVT